MTALDVRKQFGSVLDLVAEKKIPITISRANRPMAVLVPVEEYESGRSAKNSQLRLTWERIEEFKKVRRKVRSADVVKWVRNDRERR